MRYSLLFTMVLVSCMGGKMPSTDPPLIEIEDGDGALLFYVSEEKSKISAGNQYYYFNGQSVVTSNIGLKGALLDGYFQRLNNEREVIEFGEFKKGLKQGVWYKIEGPNRIMETYANGVKSGITKTFQNDQLTLKGNYKEDMKDGKFYFYDQEKISQLLKYEKGEIVDTLHTGFDLMGRFKSHQ